MQFGRLMVYCANCGKLVEIGQAVRRAGIGFDAVVCSLACYQDLEVKSVRRILGTDNEDPCQQEGNAGATAGAATTATQWNTTTETKNG